RGHRSDAINIAGKRSGPGVEDHILNAGNLQKGKAQSAFVGTRLADELQVNPVTVGFVIFLVAATDNAVIVGHQQAAETAFGVVGEVVAVEYPGGGVGNRA